VPLSGFLRDDHSSVGDVAATEGGGALPLAADADGADLHEDLTGAGCRYADFFDLGALAGATINEPLHRRIAHGCFLCLNRALWCDYTMRFIYVCMTVNVHVCAIKRNNTAQLCGVIA
jgi:hypothetical protein